MLYFYVLKVLRKNCNETRTIVLIRTHTRAMKVRRVKNDIDTTLNAVSATFLLVLFKSKREDLWNLEKCFLFHFKSSFGSRENLILVF